MSLHTMLEIRQQHVVRELALLSLLLAAWACDRAPARSKPWRTKPSPEALASLGRSRDARGTSPFAEQTVTPPIVELPMGAPPGSLLPFGDRPIWGRRITSGPVYETLLEFRSQPKQGALFGPLLAESWRYDKGRGSVEVTIKSDVRFHDGATLVMDDVLASLQGSGTFAHVGGSNRPTVEALDSRRLQITNADGFAIRELARVPIVSAAELAGRRTSGCPAGTGPYRLATCPAQPPAKGDARIANEVLLERHDEYWGAKAAVGRVRFSLEEEAAGVIASALQGRWGLLPSLAPADLAHALSRRGVNRLYREEKRPTSRFSYVVFNTRRQPFVSAGERERVAHALLRGVIDSGRKKTSITWGPVTCRKESPLPWPEFVVGENPTDVPAVDQQTQNGIPAVDQQTQNDVPAVVAIAEVHNAKALAKRSAVLQRHGWNVDEVVLPTKTFFNRLERGDFDLAWIDWDDIQENDFRPVLNTSGRNNYGGFADIEVDRAVNDLAQSVSVTQCDTALQAFHERLVQTWPWVPMSPAEQSFLVHKQLRGVVFARRWLSLSSLHWSR